MNDILFNVDELLKNNDYSTWYINDEDGPVLGFEDDTAVGYIFIFDTVAALLDGFKVREQRVLARQAPLLKTAGGKAWNCYCAFLTADRAVDATKLRIALIEEDLSMTRKLARANVLTREALVDAIIPLLRIQSHPILTNEHYLDRMKAALTSYASPEAIDLLFSDVSIEDVFVALIGGS